MPTKKICSVLLAVIMLLFNTAPIFAQTVEPDIQLKKSQSEATSITEAPQKLEIEDGFENYKKEETKDKDTQSPSTTQEPSNTNQSNTSSKEGTAVPTPSTVSGTEKATVNQDVRKPGMSYSSHVQNIGWQSSVPEGWVSGTTGKSYRVEAIQINLSERNNEISYKTHCQNVGWTNWSTGGTTNGTSGKSYRMEALRIKLTGELEKNYDIYYRAHVENIGWMNWVKNGEEAGTTGRSLRIEAYQIKLVNKGSAVEEIDPQITSCSAELGDIDLINVHATIDNPENATAVKFVVWSSEIGTNDQKWYEGTYNNGQWSASINTDEHQIRSGEYQVRCYVDIINKDSIKKACTVVIPKRNMTATRLENTNLIYRVNIENVPSSVQEVIIPTWTDENGQDDIVWHKANKVGNHTYQLNLDIRNDHFNGKTLWMHAYGKVRNNLYILEGIGIGLNLRDLTQHVGHRGNSSGFPENSLAAFKHNAWKYAECDIWPTSDNQWVIMHDGNLDRMTNGSGYISSKTLSEIRNYRIDAGNNIHGTSGADRIIPTLKEYLSICKSRDIIPVIEIKTNNISGAAYNTLVADLNAYGYNASNMVFISFYAQPLREMEKRFPGVEQMYLTGDPNNDINVARSISSNCGIDTTYNSVSQNTVNTFRSQGMTLGVWTVPNNLLAKYRYLKVDYITLN